MSTVRPVRVLVNAVSANSGGGATYAVEQLAALATRRDLVLTVLACDPTAERLRARAPGADVRSIRRRPLWRRLLWEQSVLAWRARRFDVLYGIGNFAVLTALTPQVVAFQNPTHFGRAARRVGRRFGTPRHRLRLWAERRLARASLRRAKAAIAISRSLRAAMLEDVPDTAAHLLPSAPPVGDTPDRSPPIPRLPSPYVLAVANDYPHKDWDGLARAFAQASDLPPLVLVGRPRASRRRSPGGAPAAGRVVAHGSEADPVRLDALYRNAAAYVAHSHLEAYPLTPLEAISRGVPVVASDIPSHREVAGARAEYYDPDDPSDLTSALRRTMRRPRPEPANGKRTWSDVAAELAPILRSVAGP